MFYHIKIVCVSTLMRFHGSILEERDNDVTKSGLQTLGSLEKVELGESCIVVNFTELECNSGEAVKHRSYKVRVAKLTS